MKTEIDPLLGQPCLAYNVQIPLSAESQIKFAQLQDAIATGCPLDSWRSPAGTLHVTVAPVVGVRYRYPEGPETVWAQRRPAAVATLHDLSAAISSWRMHFHALRISPTAIFAVADDHGITRKFRAALRLPETNLPLLPEAHVTLFRFQRTFELNDAASAQIESLPVAIEESVAEFFIMRESRYPSLACQAVERFVVGG